MDKIGKLLLFVTVIALIVDTVYPWGMSGSASDGLQRTRRSLDSKGSLTDHLIRVARSPAKSSLKKNPGRPSANRWWRQEDKEKPDRKGRRSTAAPDPMPDEGIDAQELKGAILLTVDEV